MTTQNQPTHVPYMMIIFTRFAGATNTRGSRIIATSTYFGKGSKVTHNKNDALSSDENHLRAALKLLQKHTVNPDSYELVGQSDNPTGSGQAWIFKLKGA